MYAVPTKLSLAKQVFKDNINTWIYSTIKILSMYVCMFVHDLI